MQTKTCRALVLYWSHGGNTKDVAEAILEGLTTDDRIESRIEVMRDELQIDYADYDLVFVGSPVYSFLPPPEVTRFLKGQQRIGPQAVPGAPELPGHAAIVFCTYGGGHTGEREAIPTLKYIGQFLEHRGIRVVDEWAVVGDFPDVQDPSYRENGRMGNIAGRPDKSELESIRGRVTGLLRQLRYVLGLG